MPVFTNYPAFKELLTFFTQSNCIGCRNGQCIYGNCGVITCHKEKKVDFCFQCNEFPCEKSNFDADLRDRWIAMNSQMKEIGVVEYYNEVKVLPRYK